MQRFQDLAVGALSRVGLRIEGTSALDLGAQHLPQRPPQVLEANIIVMRQGVGQAKAATDVFEGQFSQILARRPPCARGLGDNRLGCAVHPRHDPLITRLGLGQRSDQVHGPVSEGLHRRGRERFHPQARIGRALSCRARGA